MGLCATDKNGWNSADGQWAESKGTDDHDCEQLDILVDANKAINQIRCESLSRLCRTSIRIFAMYHERKTPHSFCLVTICPIGSEHRPKWARSPTDLAQVDHIWQGEEDDLTLIFSPLELGIMGTTTPMASSLAPILHLGDKGKEVSNSLHGLGAVLMQDGRPIRLPASHWRTQKKDMPT